MKNRTHKSVPDNRRYSKFVGNQISNYLIFNSLKNQCKQSIIIINGYSILLH